MQSISRRGSNRNIKRSQIPITRIAGTFFQRIEVVCRQQRKRNCAQRLQALDMLDSPLRHAGAANVFGRSVHRQRLEMEQTLGHLRLLCPGTLPTWVRRPHRVAPWLGMKIIVLNFRTARRRGKIKRLAA